MGRDRQTRRHFLRSGLALVSLALLPGCGVPVPGARQPTKLPRVGVVSIPGSLADVPYQAFRRGLSELGYPEGRVVDAG